MKQKTISLQVRTTGSVEVLPDNSVGYSLQISPRDYDTTAEFDFEDIPVNDILDQISVDDAVDYYDIAELLDRMPEDRIAQFLEDTGHYKVEER